MAELPEITVLSRQMNELLPGRMISSARFIQKKNLNMSPDKARRHIIKQSVAGAECHGKWIIIHLSGSYSILYNLGMGADTFFFTTKENSNRYHILIVFDDFSVLAIRFWWFGHFHIVETEKILHHPMISKLGPHITDLTRESFMALFRGRRGSIKNFILKQSNMAGLGNAYAHDILFDAGIHPMSEVTALPEEEISGLYSSMLRIFRESIRLNGSYWEQDLLGNHGNYTAEHMLIGYKEGKPCPRCRTPVQRIKTGSTQGFICPSCQRLKRSGR